MTFEYRILPEQSCIVERFTGDVTLQDVFRCSEQLWADPHYRREYNGISDLSAATTSASIADVFLLISFLRRPEVSVGRWAAIFRDPRTTALGLLFQNTVASHFRFTVFSGWDAACGFINTPVDRGIFHSP